MLNILLETVPILREVALMNPGNGKAFKIIVIIERK